MYRDTKGNDSPNHFVVLDAISRGMKTTDKISKVTRLHKSEVEQILNDLALQRLVVQNVKKGSLKSVSNSRLMKLVRPC
jgi:transcription initiation factor IIE alpha subunit